MRIVPVTLDSPPQLLDAFHRLDCEMWADDLPGLEPPARGESLAELDDELAYRRSALAAVEDGGETVVGMWTGTQNLLEDVDLAMGWTVVGVADRRRGVGSALFAAARAALLADGCKRLESSVRVGSAASAFARRHGARVMQVELCNVLDLDRVPTDLLQRSLVASGGYQLVTWEDECPAALLEAFATAHDAMNDVPLGDTTHEDWTWTGERVRSSEARRRRAGFRVFTTAAVHVDTGDVGGYTELMATGRRTTAVQEDTGVARPHRGHGLGLLLKLTNLQVLADRAPTLRTVVTWNAETNTHMLAVNERLGFQPHSRWEQVTLDL